MRRLYVDKKGHSGLPPGNTVEASTDIDFLRALSSTTDLVVRGERLCDWAVSLWRGRGWPIEPLLSPVDELADCVGPVEPGQMDQLYEENIAKLKDIARPFTLQRVLEALYPEDALWRMAPSLSHAASWLIWLSQTNPQGPVLALIRVQSMLWKAACSGPEALLYDAYSGEGARGLLASWLCYGDEPLPIVLPCFPLEVPDRCLHAAARVWRSRVVATRGEFVRGLLGAKLPHEAKQLAAELAFSYYRQNQGDLTKESVRLLENYLLPGQLTELRRLMPPASPPPCPRLIRDVVRWFRAEYLPFRMWCLDNGDPVVAQLGAARAREFATWYIDMFPQAIASGCEHISFARAAAARSRASEAVTLLVIADGLCIPDSDAMIRKIVARNNRLSVSRNDIVFAPIPTITEVCKPALKCGCCPRDIVDVPSDTSGIHLLAENEEPHESLAKASAGDCFIWPHTEPDKTYHSHADPHTLLERAQGAIDTLARRIVKAVDAVPSHLRLRVIVTTDHGRLLARSIRIAPVPFEWESHQRMSWGIANRTLPREGYELCEGGEQIYLDGRRFGFSNERDCVVLLTDDAFLTGDGKSGPQYFPHGGLSPEEVLIPWCEIDRDVEPPQIECVASGSARQDTLGEVGLLCRNAGAIDVTLLSVAFYFREKSLVEIVLDEPLLRMKEIELTCRIEHWPTPSELRAASAIARLKTPTGEELSVPITLDLKSEGFYEQDDILGDLL